MRVTMAAPPLRSDSFRLDAFEPAYLVLHREGQLAERAAAARRARESCGLCPRGGEARRLEGRVERRPAKTGWDGRRPPAPKPRRPGGNR